ncbi:MAG: hypothetical protein ACREAA_01920 [Candidatus Polarisedimenticolia bacterium]
MTAARSRRRTPAWIVAAFASAACISAATETHATTLRKMDLPELVSSADRVVHARVTGSTVAWNEEHTLIYTDTTLEVLAEAKGTGPASMIVRTLGGRIDPFELREEGTPIFMQGEEVVLFTLEGPEERALLVGFCQGVMRVQPEPQTGDLYALSEVPLGVEFVMGPQLTEVRPSPLRARLDTLMDEVRRMTAGGPAGPVLSTTPATDPEGGTP